MFLIKHVLHLLKDVVLSVLVALLIAHEVAHDLTLVLTFGVLGLATQRFLLLGLLPLLDGVQANARQLDRVLLECALVFLAYPILLENFIDEGSDWDSTDRAILLLGLATVSTAHTSQVRTSVLPRLAVDCCRCN